MVKILMLCLLLVFPALAQEPMLLPVQLVARDASWSVRLPGEPELRVRRRSFNWSYLHQAQSSLYMVVEAGGWPLAQDQAGWMRTAGAVVGSMAGGRPVEARPDIYQGRPSCLLQSSSEKGKTLRARAVQLADGRHVLLACIPVGDVEPASDDFFASLALPAVITGQQVNAGDWSITFPEAPSGQPPELRLSRANGSTFSASERAGTEAVEQFQKEMQALGKIVAQRSYPVEGRPMHQYTVRGTDEVVSYHRLILLSDRRSLELTATRADADTAQAFFSSMRVWILPGSPAPAPKAP